MTFYGKGVALAGMKTACGARLIATQFTDIVEIGGSTFADQSASMAHAAWGSGAGAPPAHAAHDDMEKKIMAISWSYGKGETPVSDVSRFYVDLNLHVDTQNYQPGEMVEVLIKDDAGNDIMDGVKEIALRAEVNSDGKAKLMNAFAGKTLITVASTACR